MSQKVRRYSSVKTTVKYIIALIALMVPIFISSIYYFPILVKRGIPFYGDVTYYIVSYNVSSKLNFINRYIYARHGLPLTLFTYGLPISILTTLLGPEWGIKAFIVLVSSLTGIFTFLAINIFLNEFIKINKGLFRWIASLAGSLFYMIAFNSGIFRATSTPVYVYALFPLSLMYLMKYVEKGLKRDLFILSLLSLLGNAQPIWLHLIIISLIIYFVLSLIFREERLVNRFYRSIVALLVISLANAYWLVPTLAGYLYGAGGIFSYYQSKKLITLQGLRFLSHWNLLDVLMVGEHSYYFFWHHPQNYGPLNTIIPLIAGTTFILYIIKRKNKHVVMLYTLLIIGIFLSKGVNPPGGMLYYYIAKILPYGAGAIMRNPTKFIPLVNFSYAVSISLLLLEMFKAFSKRKYLKYISLALFIAAVISPVAYGTYLDFREYAWVRFQPTYVPSIYLSINKWLNNDNSPFKVVWIPSGGAYIWKPYVITAFPDLLSSKPTVSFRKIYPNPLENTDEVGGLLRVLGVKYVIYHGDSISYPNDKILSDLVRQKDLRIVYMTDYTFKPPKDNSKAPFPRGVKGLSFSNSPFKLISPSYLPRGKEVTLILKYKIPDEVVERGFKGRFSPGFNIALAVYEAGYAFPDKRVAWVAAYKQVMVNETSGYVYFKVKVPYNYLGTAVDLYAWFYDGGFKPLTPKYFIERLIVKPKEIRIPFIVFENEDYSGPVYVANLALAYGVNLSELLNIGFLNTSSWAIVFAKPGIPQEVLKSVKLIIYHGGEPPSWLVSSLKDSSFIYVWPLGRFNLPMEKATRGPYEPKYYVYDERPLKPVRNYVLERGRWNLLTFKYTLPQEVVERGFNGKFGARFGIILIGFPHGIAPPPAEKNKYKVFEVAIHNYTLINDYEGYVTFNVTIPENFGWSSVDVYAWFYDGSLRRLSPMYYVGTFKVRGTTLLKNRDGFVIHMVNSGLLLRAYAPEKGVYTLFIKARGVLRVNGNEVVCSGFGSPCLVNLTLGKGINEVYISSTGESFIKEIALLNSKALKSMSTNSVHAYVISYREVNPTKWMVTLNASKPFVLVFTEPYDRLWRAYIDGEKVSPIPLYGLVNGFIVNKTGVIHVKLYYTLQTYYEVGIAVSALTFAALLVGAVREWMMTRRQGSLSRRITT